MAAAPAVTHAENSDVLLDASVAVAVTISAGDVWRNGIVALPAPSVVTDVDPRKVCPSPFPDGSQAVFPKNWMTNDAFAVLFSVPTTPPAAAVNTGKFCRLFGPLSASPGSFGVTPDVPMSMPSCPLEKMEFPAI